MKKILALFLVLIVCLSLTACGKSEKAQSFENLVNNIGTVTLNSEEAIISAEDAFNNLSEDDKASVADSKKTLIGIRNEYDSLVEKISNVTTLIGAIGDDVLQSEPELVAAEQAFSELTNEEKEMIPDESDKLAKAREAFNSAIEDQIEKTINAIDSIGKVTTKSKSTIESARKLYDTLSADNQKNITNADKLTKAEEEFEKLWETEKKKIINTYSKKFDIDKDPIEGVTWYMHSSMPTYIDDRCYIIPYIGVNGDNAWICIRYNYTADEWIFWKKLTVMADGTKYSQNVDYFDIVRDNDTEVWEYYDECLNYNLPMDSTQIDMLRKIANSNETIVRFAGDEYHHDLYVTNSDKQMIKDVLTLYEALIG